MKTAKEMFKKLGWDKTSEYNYRVAYIKYDRNDNEYLIMFNKGNRDIEFEFPRGINQLAFCKKLFQAIQKQIEELGWCSNE